jgi:hypothetical protein
MSVLAQITVVECDGCKRLATLTNPVERETFEQTWHRTRDKDFCFLCRETIELADEKVISSVVAKINRKYGAVATLEVTNG